MNSLRLLLLLAVVLLLFLGPAIIEEKLGNSPFSPPSANHPFGTDQLGRDVWARTWEAGRLTLTISLIGTALAITIGLIIGTFSGYSGRRMDFILMRGVDVMLPIPSILLTMILLMAFSFSPAGIGVAVGLPLVPFFARQIRAFVLPLREKEFVRAAEIYGGGTWHILRQHIMLNISQEVGALAVTTFTWAMLNLSALDFMGLLGNTSIYTWGKMLNEGRLYLSAAPWLVFFPALILTGVVYGANRLSRNITILRSKDAISE